MWPNDHFYGSQSDMAVNDSHFYCDACQHHGTDVHICDELRSVVVSARDLRAVLSGDDDMPGIRERLEAAYMEYASDLEEELG